MLLLPVHLYSNISHASAANAHTNHNPYARTRFSSAQQQRVEMLEKNYVCSVGPRRRRHRHRQRRRQYLGGLVDWTDS